MGVFSALAAGPARRTGEKGLLAAWSSLALSAILLVVYLHLPVYAYTLDRSFLPKYFYFGFGLLLAPILFLRLQEFLSYLASPFAVWASAVLLLNIAHLLTGGEISARTADVISFRMQAVAMVTVLGFVFSLAPKSSYQRVFVFLAILLPADVIIDFLQPGLIYPVDTTGAVLGRAAGTFINPTIAGEGILLTFLFACKVLPKNYRTPLLLLSGMGILLTFTRAAVAAWLLIWLFLLVRRRLSAFGAIAAMLVVAIPLALGSFQSYLNNRGDLDKSLANLQNRLSILSAKRLDDASAIERASVLQGGWNLFLKHPATGAGAGATDTGMTPAWPHPVGTHNQLVMLLAEYGVAGGALWFWLGMLLIRGRYFEDRALQSAAILLFVTMTFFTHNMFDFPYWLLTFSFLAQRAGRPQPGPAAFAPALRHE